MEENIISALIARIGALIPLMDILRGKRSAKNVKIKIRLKFRIVRIKEAFKL